MPDQSDVASPPASDLLDPVVNRLMGPRVNRRTLDNIGKAGLAVMETRNVFSDWVKVIVGAATTFGTQAHSGH